MNNYPTKQEIEQFLRLAMKEAETAAECGNHPYGALIVSAEGAIVAVGRNGVNTECDPTSHAEANAIRAACRQLGTLSLADYRLFTNGAPCAMCAAIIIHTGISDVWYAAPTPAGRAMPTIEDMAARSATPPTVIQGILAEEATAQLVRWES